ncbi:VRR-NUC domain-containing protein [Paraburkholderia sp. D15]|uniref:VRR-NUC domain-containing protein n=1 Tax=Paraburkholderia sp. D15 TaxID=2880218 RepID=UPI002479DA79|nr:VRR-NUC domain-containing protein [Paraburkholderia sp. D15]WGS49296.1 VRR-NUC domain-containing protein [Paraburkholderia sp. D15]
MNWQSPYKSEVNYDMTQVPPVPIMRSVNPLETHPYLPAWIARYWPGGKSNYPAGTGAIRRPDVVIVKDGSLPPTQNNIKNIVEIKFPPQAPSLDQAEDYVSIAGSAEKVVILGPQNCDCREDDKGENPVKAAVSDALSELGKSLTAIFNPKLPTTGFGLPPPFPPLPVP